MISTFKCRNDKHVYFCVFSNDPLSEELFPNNLFSKNQLPTNFVQRMLSSCGHHLEEFLFAESFNADFLLVEPPAKPDKPAKALSETAPPEARPPVALLPEEPLSTPLPEAPLIAHFPDEPLSTLLPEAPLIAPLPEAPLIAPFPDAPLSTALLADATVPDSPLPVDLPPFLSSCRARRFKSAYGATSASFMTRSIFDSVILQASVPFLCRSTFRSWTSSVRRKNCRTHLGAFLCLLKYLTSPLGWENDNWLRYFVSSSLNVISSSWQWLHISSIFWRH